MANFIVKFIVSFREKIRSKNVFYFYLIRIKQIFFLSNPFVRTYNITKYLPKKASRSLTPQFYCVASGMSNLHKNPIVSHGNNSIFIYDWKYLQIWRSTNAIVVCFFHCPYQLFIDIFSNFNEIKNTNKKHSKMTAISPTTSSNVLPNTCNLLFEPIQWVAHIPMK